MSILIPDMKMPKDGCKSCGFDILGICLIKANMDKPYEVTHSYPLIELPPHGRLIDADAIVKKSYEIKSCVGRYSRVVHIEDVKNADTIIPADPEGGR